MARPRLEMLERRFAPATLQDFGGTAPHFVQATMSLSPAAFDHSWPIPANPAIFSPVADDAAFLSRPLDPLLSQIGRFPEPSLEFAPSGNAGGRLRVELDILPAIAPVPPAPSAEQVDELFMEPEAAPPEE